MFFYSLVLMFWQFAGLVILLSGLGTNVVCRQLQGWQSIIALMARFLLVVSVAILTPVAQAGLITFLRMFSSLALVL